MTMYFEDPVEYYASGPRSQMTWNRLQWPVCDVKGGSRTTRFSPKYFVKARRTEYERSRKID